MVWLDFALVSVVLFTSGLGFVRGFIKEAVSLLSWGLGFFAGIKFHHLLLPFISKIIENEKIAILVSFALIFILIFALMLFMGAFLRKILSMVAMGVLDKFAGLVFGALKGIVIVSAAVMVLNITSVLPKKIMSDSVIALSVKGFTSEITEKFEPGFRSIRNFLKKV